MEGMNGSAPTGLDEVMRGLTALIEAKQAEIDLLKARLDVMQAELKPMLAMQRVATPSAPAAKMKGKTPAARYGEEELGIIVAKIRARKTPVVAEIPGSFTVRALADELGLSPSVAERAVNYLRENERVRLVGERVVKGTRPSRIFVLNDE